MAWKKLNEISVGDAFVMPKGEFSNHLLIAVHDNGDWTVRSKTLQGIQQEGLWKAEDLTSDEWFWVERIG